MKVNMLDIGTDRSAEGGLAVNETERLIASDKVEGTSVYDRDANHIGAIYNVMIDKYPGQVAYAVVSFGGFLGIGTHYHPIPWKKLNYDRALGGYVADITREKLERAPRYASDQSPWGDPAYGRSVYDYYDIPYYM
jgi:sporulation protein YlmC with PRC-barrel domain